MKKSYEKPVVELIDFKLEDSIMDVEIDDDMPSGSIGEEDW